MYGIMYWPDLSSRDKRRKTVRFVIEQLEDIISAEDRYRNNIPPNLSGSDLYYDSFAYADTLHCVIEDLSRIF
jgi:hypothetical protein